MCPQRFGCILPHSGPSSQCQICALCERCSLLKQIKLGRISEKCNMEWACWTVGGQLALPPLHRSLDTQVGRHFCFSTTLDFHFQHPGHSKIRTITYGPGHTGYFKPWFGAIILLFYHSFWCQGYHLAPPWPPWCTHDPCTVPQSQGEPKILNRGPKFCMP